MQLRDLEIAAHDAARTAEADGRHDEGHLLRAAGDLIAAARTRPSQRIIDLDGRVTALIAV